MFDEMWYNFTKLTGGGTILINTIFLEAMENIISSLRERGYDPYLQIYGFLQEDDPAYITSHNGARDLIKILDKEDIRMYIDSYFEKSLKNRKA